jgi:hypothetical protein
VATVASAVGDALGDALVRPGCVVVRLVRGQASTQMRLTENQQAIELSRLGTGLKYSSGKIMLVTCFPATRPGTWPQNLLRLRAVRLVGVSRCLGVPA